MAYNWCICRHTKGVHKIIDEHQRELCYRCDERDSYLIIAYNNPNIRLVDDDGFIFQPCYEFKLDNIRYLESKSKKSSSHLA
jgi:hypothetical protein